MNELEATRAKLKCLEMVEGTGLKWWEVVRYLDTKLVPDNNIYFNCHNMDYEFALGLVEGKPVWAGDEVYCEGNPTHATEICNFKHPCWSWNPHKPKTVLVELLVEDAKAFEEANQPSKPIFVQDRISEACRKALENIK